MPLVDCWTKEPSNLLEDCNRGLKNRLKKPCLKLKEIELLILNHAGFQLCCRYYVFPVEINDQMFYYL